MIKYLCVNYKDPDFWIHSLFHIWQSWVNVSGNFHKERRGEIRSKIVCPFLNLLRKWGRMLASKAVNRSHLYRNSDTIGYEFSRSLQKRLKRMFVNTNAEMYSWQYNSLMIKVKGFGLNYSSLYVQNCRCQKWTINESLRSKQFPVRDAGLIIGKG